MKLRIVPGFDESKNILAASLCELKNSGLLMVYDVDGKTFYQVTQWESHQNFNAKNRGLNSKYPDPVKGVAVNHSEPLEEVEVEVEFKLNKKNTFCQFGELTDTVYRYYKSKVKPGNKALTQKYISMAVKRHGWTEKQLTGCVDKYVASWTTGQRGDPTFRSMPQNFFSPQHERYLEWMDEKAPQSPKGMRRDTPEYEEWCRKQAEKREKAKQLNANET